MFETIHGKNFMIIFYLITVIYVSRINKKAWLIKLYIRFNLIHKSYFKTKYKNKHTKTQNIAR